MATERNREAATVAYALVVEGISTIFVNDEALDDAWAVAQGFVDTHPGLSLPSSLAVETNLRTGAMPSTSTTFDLAECDGTRLAAIFGGVWEETEPIASTLEPGATAGASVWGKYVGIEKIGAAGQRGLYPCVPGFTRPMRHIGADQYGDTAPSRPARSSALPVVSDGRRCTFWRVYLLDDGTYEDLTAAQLVWWGTLTGAGSQQGHEWKIEADGPHSWIERQIGTHLWTESRACYPVVTLAEDERYVRGQVRWHGQNDNNEYYGILENEAYLTGSLDYITLSGEFAQLLDDIANAANGAGHTMINRSTFNAVGLNWEAGFHRIVTRWTYAECIDVTAPDLAYLNGYIVMHGKVWAALGFDVAQQEAMDVGDANYMHFSPWEALPGYYAGHIDSRSPALLAELENNVQANAEWIAEWATHFDSGGTRYHHAIYSGGYYVFDPAGNQDVIIKTFDRVYIRGQLTQPPSDDPDDPGTASTIAGQGAVTDQNLFAFHGLIFEDGDEEPRQTVQIARCSFRAHADGYIAGDSDKAYIHVDKWLDPRAFHFPHERFTTQWVALQNDADNAIQVQPLAELAYKNSSGDKATLVIRRLLHTTGTATGWWEDAGFSAAKFGTEEPAFFEAGTNDADGATTALDADIETMGLAIPSSMIAGVSTWTDAEAPLTGIKESLRYGKVVIAHPESSADILQGILAPRGWAWSLRGGKYGVFNPDALVTPADVDKVITVEHYHNPSMKPTMQRRRAFGAFGSVNLDASRHPLEGDMQYTRKFTSADPAARFLASGVVHDVSAPSLLSPDNVPTSGDGWDWARWGSDFDMRWSELATFWARAHIPVRLTMHARDAADLWPGSKVMLTDASIFDPYTRSYGVTGLTGYVTERDVDVTDESTTIDVLLHASSSYGIRMYGPSARAWAYDPNLGGSGYRLMVSDDYRDFRGNDFDVDRFVEAANTSHGGAALVEVFQYDRTGWTGGIYGTIASITQSAGTCSINLTGALSGGTYYRDKDSIVVLRNWAAQSAAWVLAQHAPICDDAGEVGGNPGKKFNGL